MRANLEVERERIADLREKLLRHEQHQRQAKEELRRVQQQLQPEATKALVMELHEQTQAFHRAQGTARRLRAEIRDFRATRRFLRRHQGNSVNRSTSSLHSGEVAALELECQRELRKQEKELERAAAKRVEKCRDQAAGANHADLQRIVEDMLDLEAEVGQLQSKIMSLHGIERSGDAKVSRIPLVLGSEQTTSALAAIVSAAVFAFCRKPFWQKRSLALAWAAWKRCCDGSRATTQALLEQQALKYMAERQMIALSNLSNHP
eukprot:gnl/MRDRNA2_/MRDRNA2_79446_c0_seq1.p1 gnl/MRDRNA2_/MRDRNA2_79446_c0~~gnl/MRDRNA2_/MRDRNA2_79446_c0_seq1.p1  ORF type:complete len:263 (-),score=61.41 gnl/MRDRNA2_/MRDRNA2_79446_c0_seq1:32-820(-)